MESSPLVFELELCSSTGTKQSLTKMRSIQPTIIRSNKTNSAYKKLFFNEKNKMELLLGTSHLFQELKEYLT